MTPFCSWLSGADGALKAALEDNAEAGAGSSVEAGEALGDPDGSNRRNSEIASLVRNRRGLGGNMLMKDY